MAGTTEAGSVFLKLQLDTSSLKNQIGMAGETSATGFADNFKTGFVSGMGMSVANFLIEQVKSAAAELFNGSEAAYQYQLAAELKLQEVMKTRMGSTKDEIQMIKDYASELQTMGIVGDEVTLQGASQLATYLSSAESLKTLIPAMQNLAVSNNGGFEVSDTTSVANMIGKVIANNSLSAMTRVGITFTEEDKKNWETLITEEEKAAFLAQVITDNVGDMNDAFVNSDAGRLQQVKNDFGDIKERIGGVIEEIKVNFLPILEDGIDLLNGWVDKIKEAADGFGDFLVYMGWKEKTDETEEYKDEVEEATDAVVKQTEAVKNLGLASFDTFNLIGSSSDSDSADSSDTNVNVNVNGSEGNNNSKDPEQEKAPGKIAQSLKGLKEAVDGFFNTKFGQILKEEFFNMIDTIKWSLGLIWGYIKEFFGTIVDLIGGLINFVGDPVGTLKDSFSNIFGGIHDYLIGGAMESAQKGKEAEAGLWKTNPELAQANYDKTLEKYTAIYGNNVTALDDESIDKLAKAVEQVSRANAERPIYLDGQKISKSTVSNINSRNKYTNSSILKK